jgi:hypothetical protein
MRKLQKPLAVALVLAALGSQSWAQFGGGMGGGRRSQGGGNAANATRNADASPGPQTRASQVNAKLYDLRSRLQLTPEQTPLWEKVSSLVWNMALHGGATQALADETQTAPQAVQRRAADAQERARQLQALNDAVDRFYATLTPEQRSMTDQSLPALIP